MFFFMPFHISTVPSLVAMEAQMRLEEKVISLGFETLGRVTDWKKKSKKLLHNWWWLRVREGISRITRVKFEFKQRKFEFLRGSKVNNMKNIGLLN